MWTDFRLKFRHWIRQYGKIIIIGFVIWGIIFMINIFLKKKTVEPVLVTSTKPHTEVIQDTQTTPKNLQKPIEDLIKKYVDYCNDGNYQAAFDMLSDDCKEISFNNDIQRFMKHVLKKMPMPKKYGIQNYSETLVDHKKLYIYEVRYYDDYISTGLTNTEYKFTSEKFTFNLNKDDKIEMNVGDYIYSVPIKSVSENEYLKIDVVDKIVKYEYETYDVRLTNRSNYTVVISDDQEIDEIKLILPNEFRTLQNRSDIVLLPNQKMDVKLQFPKFSDDGDIAQKILFSSVRVMENYSGTSVDEAIIQSEIDNAITKFSMEVGIGER